jgi:transposase, IS30 family
MAQGLTNSAACRELGIERRTANKWRYGFWITNSAGIRRFVPPLQAVTPRVRPPESGRYLSEDERITIADGVRAGRSLRSIAAGLGRSSSTVSREVARNRDPLRVVPGRRRPPRRDGSIPRNDRDKLLAGGYHPHRAQERAQTRRPRPKQRKLAVVPELHTFVQARLRERWSPEQIARTLPSTFPGRAEMRVTTETIYQAIYVQGRGELRRDLHRALRTGRAYRRPQRRPEQRRNRFSAPMLMISERPAEVADRAIPGHWEGDLIMGLGNSTAIGTLVERSTRYVMLLHLPHGKQAEHLRDALLTAVAELPAHLRRSLTWDQGSEMGRHHEFSVAADMPVYFCDPASPWQRGSNENTNGLLRQYFPKGTDLSAHSPRELAAVAQQLNARPRKTLGWNTPAEQLAALVAKSA